MNKNKRICKTLALMLAMLMLFTALTGCGDVLPGEDSRSGSSAVGQEGSEEPEVLDGPAERAKELKEDYPKLDEDNVLTYATWGEVNAMLRHGTGVILFTWTDCPWCQEYIEYVNEAAIKADIGTVLCYDIHEDREANNEHYQFFVEWVEPFLDESNAYDASGNLRIYVPELVFVVNGEVVAHNNETSMIGEGEADPETYWSEVDENGVMRSTKFVESLCEPFNMVCEALSEINGRGCNSCVATRPDREEKETPNA